MGGSTQQSWWAKALALSSTGIVLVTAILIGYFLGAYLDGEWGTSPWLMAAGVLLGCAAGFVELYRAVRRFLG